MNDVNIVADDGQVLIPDPAVIEAEKRAKQARLERFKKNCMILIKNKGKYLPVKAAAEILQISDVRLYLLMKDGKLSYIKIGRDKWVNVDDLVRWASSDKRLKMVQHVNYEAFVRGVKALIRLYNES